MAEATTDRPYTLPAVVAVALDTKRPEVIRALKEEAADKLRGLSEPLKMQMVSELFRLIADMLEEKQQLQKKLDVYDEMAESFKRARDEIDNIVDDLTEGLSAIDG